LHDKLRTSPTLLAHEKWTHDVIDFLVKDLECYSQKKASVMPTKVKFRVDSKLKFRVRINVS